MPDKKLTAADLAGFIGRETFYRHSLMRGVVYTEGVKFLVERAGAYWLLDKIATLQLDATFRLEDFQAWKLVVSGHKAALTCDDGNGNVLYTEEIRYTDFPLDTITLWLVRGEARTVMLPSEY